MNHIAILRKANIKKGDNLLEDILNGTKTIESRWYVNKTAPWNKIKAKDIVYFKESGCPVTAKAIVSKVIQYENLTPKVINKIISDYGSRIAPNISRKAWQAWIQKQNKKRYCILVFLEDVKKVKPFVINKTGYGISSAWLVTESVSNLKRIKI